MEFVTGFLIWIAFAVIAAFGVRALYRTPGTAGWVRFMLALFGAFIGGMLGVSAHILHNPTPLRVGGLIGSAAGAVFFTWLYHFIQRRFA